MERCLPARVVQLEVISDCFSGWMGHPDQLDTVTCRRCNVPRAEAALPKVPRPVSLRAGRPPACCLGPSLNQGEVSKRSTAIRCGLTTFNHAQRWGQQRAFYYREFSDLCWLVQQIH